MEDVPRTQLQSSYMNQIFTAIMELTDITGIKIFKCCCARQFLTIRKSTFKRCYRFTSVCLYACIYICQYAILACLIQKKRALRCLNLFVF